MINKKSSPDISVISAIYNGDIDLIKDSINSIINQSFKNFEYIIVNDASNQKTKKFLEKISKKDARILLLSNKHNIGLTKSLNKALKIAKGQLIARLDSDDIASKRKLEIQYKYFQNHPDCTLLATNFNFKRDGQLVKINYPEKFKRENIKKILKHKNIFVHSTVMFKRKEIIQIGCYDPNFKYAQDYDLWLRISENFECHHIRDKLVNCELHNNSLSNVYSIQQKGFSILAKIKAMNRTKNKLEFLLPLIVSALKYPKAFYWLLKNFSLIKNENS